MRVKLKQRYARPLGNFAPGSEADLPSKEAKGLIDGGYAVTLEGAAAIETATIEPEERAVTEPQRTDVSAKKTAKKRSTKQ